MIVNAERIRVCCRCDIEREVLGGVVLEQQCNGNMVYVSRIQAKHGKRERTTGQRRIATRSQCVEGIKDAYRSRYGALFWRDRVPNSGKVRDVRPRQCDEADEGRHA